MNIIIGESWKYKQRPVDIVKYATDELDGADYGNGQMETLEEGITNTHKAFGRLLEILARKGLITAPEVTEIVEDCRWDGATFEKQP